MKTTITRLLKLLALILPIVLFVSFMQDFMFFRSNQTAERIRRFYQEEENSLDVVFLGASDVCSGFSPGLAYENYGFTSYLYTFDANPATLYKYQLKEVLSTQQPAVIFVELNGFLYDDSYQSQESTLCLFTDNIPFSLNKLETIHSFGSSDVLRDLVPFIRYHGNWINGNRLIEACRWRVSTGKSPSLLKGITSCTKVTAYDPALLQGSQASDPEQNRIAQACLIDFLEYCKAQELSNIRFLRYPHRNSAHFADAVAYVEALIADYGYPVLNLENCVAEIGLDFNRDFYDDEHLNIYGQEKMTAYLGSYIANTLLEGTIPQSEKNASHWAECVDAYKVYHAYAYDRTEKGIETWPGEEPYEVKLIQAWVSQS